MTNQYTTVLTCFTLPCTSIYTVTKSGNCISMGKKGVHIKVRAVAKGKVWDIGVKSRGEHVIHLREY